MLQLNLSPSRPAPSPKAANVVVEYDEDGHVGVAQTVYAHTYTKGQGGNGSSGSSPSDVESSPAGGSYLWNADSSIKKAVFSPQNASGFSSAPRAGIRGIRGTENGRANNHALDDSSVRYSDLEVVDPYDDAPTGSPQGMYDAAMMESAKEEEEEDSPMARIPPNNVFQRDPSAARGRTGDATQRNAFLEELLLHVDDDDEHAHREGSNEALREAELLPKQRKSPSPERHFANAPSQLWSDTSSATSRSASVASFQPPPPFTAGAGSQRQETSVGAATVLSEKYRQAQDELHEAFLHVGSRIAKLRETSPSPSRPRSASASPPSREEAQPPKSTTTSPSPTTTPVHFQRDSNNNSGSSLSLFQNAANRSTSAGLSHTSPQSAQRSRLSVSPGEGSRLMGQAPSQQQQTPMLCKPPRAPTSTPHGPGLIVHEVTVHMDSEDEHSQSAAQSSAGAVGSVVWSESEDEDMDEPQPRDPTKDASPTIASGSSAPVDYGEYFGREPSPPPRTASPHALSPLPPPPADRVERVLPFSRRSISPEREEQRGGARTIFFSPKRSSPSPPGAPLLGEEEEEGDVSWRQRGNSPPVAAQNLFSHPRRRASSSPSPPSTLPAVTVPESNAAEEAPRSTTRKVSLNGKINTLTQTQQKRKKSYSPPSVSISPMSEDEDPNMSSSGNYAYSSNSLTHHDNSYNASHDDFSFYTNSPPQPHQQQQQQQQGRRRRSTSRESAVERPDTEVQLYLRGSHSRSPPRSSEEATSSRSPSPRVPHIESVRGQYLHRASPVHVVTPPAQAMMNESVHNNSNSSHTPFISLTPYLHPNKSKDEQENGSTRLVCAVEVEIAPGSTAFLQVYRHQTVEEAVYQFMAEHSLDADTVFVPLVDFVASQVRQVEENSLHNTSGASSGSKSEASVRAGRVDAQMLAQQQEQQQQQQQRQRQPKQSQSLRSRARRPTQEGKSMESNGVSTAMAYLESLLSGKGPTDQQQHQQQPAGEQPQPPRRLRSHSTSPDVVAPTARSLSLSPPPPVSILVDRMRSNTRPPERSVDPDLQQQQQQQQYRQESAPHAKPQRGRSRSEEVEFARETNSSRLRRRSAEQKLDELTLKKEEEAAQEFGLVPPPKAALVAVIPPPSSIVTAVAPKVDNQTRRMLPRKEKADLMPKKTRSVVEVSVAASTQASRATAPPMAAKRQSKRSPSTAGRRTGSAPVMTSRDSSFGAGAAAATALYAVQPAQTRSSLLRQQQAASARREKQIQEEKIAMGMPATTVYHPIKRESSMNSSSSTTVSNGPSVSRKVLLPRRNKAGNTSTDASREEPQPLWKQSLLWQNNNSSNNSLLAFTSTDAKETSPTRRQEQEQRMKELYTLHQSFLQEQKPPQEPVSRLARSPQPAAEPRRAHSAAATAAGGDGGSNGVSRERRRVRFVDPLGEMSPSEEKPSPRAPYTDLSSTNATTYKPGYTLKSKKGQFLQSLNENILFNNAVHDASVGLKAPLLSPPSNRADANPAKEPSMLLRPFATRLS